MVRRNNQWTNGNLSIGAEGGFLWEKQGERSDPLQVRGGEFEEKGLTSWGAGCGFLRGREDGDSVNRFFRRSVFSF